MVFASSFFPADRTANEMTGAQAEYSKEVFGMLKSISNDPQSIKYLRTSSIITLRLNLTCTK